jgi:hypothetical protein
MVAPSKRRQAPFLPFQAVAVAVVSLDTQASPAFQGFLATTLARAAFPVSAVTLAFLAIQDLVSQDIQAPAYQDSRVIPALACQATQDFLDCQAFLGCRAFQAYQATQDQESLAILGLAYLATRAFQVSDYQGSQAQADSLASQDYLDSQASRVTRDLASQATRVQAYRDSLDSQV